MRKSRSRGHYEKDSGCCDADRDARLMGYSNSYVADLHNWGNPIEEIKRPPQTEIEKDKNTDLSND